jgi:hypothetical protein
MDEQLLRKHAEAHANAVVANDFDALLQDFTAEMHANLGGLAQAMPQPVESATVTSVDATANPAVVHIAYAGAGKEVTIRSEWSGDDRPRITGAAPTS